MRLFCFSDTHQRALPDCEPAPDAWLFGGDLYDKPDRGVNASPKLLLFGRGCV